MEMTELGLQRQSKFSRILKIQNQHYINYFQAHLYESFNISYIRSNAVQACSQSELNKILV